MRPATSVCRRRSMRRLGLLFSTLLAFGCSGTSPIKESQASPAFVKTSGSAPDFSDDGQWTMPSRDPASRRYSTLTQITSDNVSNLRVAFTFSTGVPRGHEAAPIVAGWSLFLGKPHPPVLYTPQFK